ncbi:MAG: DUF4326 domain-containing protein [Actinomycetota bacterium]|nr:DUF4326 domain-containing protein [Actinomycetota bacterium]
MSPVRIQRKRTRGWKMPEGAVYVGRPSRWGNPFRVYHGHTLIGPSWVVARASWSHLPAEQCLACYVTSSAGQGPEDLVSAYRTLMTVRLRDEPERLNDWLAPLCARNLACWCPLDQPCHADVLLDLANRSAPEVAS